jgi:UDP:flavonoid glycosyltransferase YjiC (YdhE family)
MRILAYTSPARGHLYPLVPIAAELAERGHRTHIRTLSGELGQLAPLGIEGSAIDPAIERNQLEDWRARLPMRAIRSVVDTLAERAREDALDLARAIDEHDPEVLVIDINCWGAAAVAEASGLPWAMYCPYLLMLPSRDAPAYGPGLAPLGGPLGTVRDALVRRRVNGVFDRAAMPRINAQRTLRGLGGIDRYGDLLGRPPLLLSLTAEGFEYPRGDWPANVRLVGPMNWAPSHPAPSHPGAPDSALAWLAQARDPLVLVTCSTERQADGRLVAAALEALPAAGMSVIATTAAHDPRAFAAPPGSMVVDFLPHEALLERAACVVCHGGMGIVQKALAAEVPVVAVPFGRDQHETARRVEVAEAGARLPRWRLTPDRLLSAVRTALDRRAGAQRVSRAFAAAGGPVAAADAIEAIA